MQTIGLIGGMSWESSAAYYELLNTGVEKRVGDLASAKTILSSVDFAEVTRLQEAEDWDGVARILVEAAQGVERAGADFLLLCTTTFHRVFDQVEPCRVGLANLVLIGGGLARFERPVRDTHELDALLGPQARNVSQCCVCTGSDETNFYRFVCHLA